MTSAIFGFVGVVIGVVLSALLNFFLQRAQDIRRWNREDKRKFEPERLALYRDFLNLVEHTRPWDSAERERLSTILSEMELLGSLAVFRRAHEVFKFTEELDAAWRDEKADHDPYDLGESEEHLKDLIYRFNRSVRKELGVGTDWRPTVLIVDGEPKGLPEDLEQIQESEKPSWWRRMFGGG